MLSSTRHSHTRKQTTLYLLLTSVSVYAGPHFSLSHACRDKWLITYPIYLYFFLTAASNASGSNAASGAGLSTSFSTGAVNKKSSVTTIKVSSSGTWWTLLSAGMVLSGGEQWVSTDELISTSLDESSSSGSSEASLSTLYGLFFRRFTSYIPFCVLIGSLLSFSTPSVPFFLLGVCDVDPARYCVELREVDSYNIR